MSYGYSRVGYRPLYPVGNVVYALDSVVEVEHLPAASELTSDCFVYESLVELHNIRLNRGAQSGSFFKHAHVHNAAHSHVQRSRNGSCGQREYVGVHRELLQLFLLGYTEALFLVDYDKSEVEEIHIL